MSITNQYRRVISTSVAALILVILSAVLPLHSGRAGVILALLWGLPALTWAISLPPRPWYERAAVGAGLAFSLTGLATFVLCLLPGEFPVAVARYLYGALAVLPCLVGRPSAPTAPREPVLQIRWQWVAAIILIAFALRVVNLNYSEFQGDEALILQRADRIIGGDTGQFFLHQKGPVEILAPLAFWALNGNVTELEARLPFALLNVLAVLAVMSLAARWYGPSVGALAGLLLAASGFMVAFGRIVQYQTVVVLWGAVSLLALTEYAQSSRPRELFVGALCLGCGFLAHYDIVLVAPAALAILIEYLVKQRVAWRKIVAQVMLAGLLGLGVLALFYLPFTLNPNFARTLRYLVEGRLGGGGVFYNNLASVWAMSTFYNAIYYVIALALGVLLAGILRVRGWAAWLYFGVPWFFYTFMVFDPRTHIYTFYPGAAILTGAALPSLWRRWLAPWVWGRRGLLAAGVVWYSLCVGYIYVAFVNHQPEYKREWPASRLALYPYPADTLPLFGFFGFPYQAGWKAVEGLYAQGVLTGTYTSNEKPAITSWYVRSGERSLCSRPDTYIIAAYVQDEFAVDWADIEQNYQLWAEIQVEGESKIWIYRPLSDTRPAVTLDAADFYTTFDAATLLGAQRPHPERGEYPVAVPVGDVARLLGYDVSATEAHPGDTLRVVLYWESLQPTLYNYQVFVHLRAGDRLVAQHDGAPACALLPTSGWEPGQIIRDEHDIVLDDSVSASVLDLYVGMYELITKAPLLTAGEQTPDIHLSQIWILP